MDTNEAIKLSSNFINKLMKFNYKVSSAWLFGSYSDNTFNDNSDIDLAIIFDNRFELDFDKEVEMMSLRNKNETIIEPHFFNEKQFELDEQFGKHIAKTGTKIL